MTVSQREIDNAARAINAGELVAFPTETVYGLGADALNKDAIRKVFALKGRPSTNPLIVHCRGIAHARMFAADWPDHAHDLANRFWPGPLTIVVRKNAFIPPIATANGDTVALRVPANDTARALIEAASVPLVGPSANPSGTISPTTAQHVQDAFPDLLVLDDGPCTTGVESTVVTFAHVTPRVLRPGVLGHEELGVAPFEATSGSDGSSSDPKTSPGLFKSHYAPRARLVLDQDVPGAERLHLPDNAADAARELYARLRALDSTGTDTIVANTPKGTGPIWDAIRDRLRRAAAPAD